MKKIENIIFGSNSAEAARRRDAYKLIDIGIVLAVAPAFFLAALGAPEIAPYVIQRWSLVIFAMTAIYGYSERHTAQLTAAERRISQSSSEVKYND